MTLTTRGWAAVLGASFLIGMYFPWEVMPWS